MQSGNTDPGSTQCGECTPAGEAPTWLAAWLRVPRPRRLRVGGFVGYLALLALLFIQPLTSLIVFAYSAQGGLYSHILAIPFIAGYLLYIDWEQPLATDKGSFFGTITLGAIGIAALAHGGPGIATSLASAATAFVSFAVAGGFLFFGSRWMAAMAFPFAFLVFLIPLPSAALNWLENASAIASTEVAVLFFRLTGVPLVQRGTELQLAGNWYVVGPECSGIRSTLVLFVVTLLVAHLFLKTRWRRTALVAFVVPIGIVRNGFRIWGILLLCVRIGPHMINSPIHRQGGPWFLALSLIPMSLLFLWLRSRESRQTGSRAPAGSEE